MRALADVITISNATEKILIGPRGAFGGGAALKFIESEEQILLFLLAALEDPADIDQLRRACDRWLFDDSDGPRRDDHRFVRDVARACLWGGLGAVVVPDFSVRLSGPVRAARNPPKRYQEAPRIPGTLPQGHEQPFPLGQHAGRQTSSPSVAHRHPAVSNSKPPTHIARMPSNTSSNTTSATSNAPTNDQKRPAMTWESSGVEEILAMEPPRRVEHPLPASLDDRLLYVFDQALKTEILADEAYKQIREKLTDRIIGKVVSALVLWGAVHFTPGAVLAIAIDIVAAGAALFFFGRSVVEGIQELHRAINLTRNARSWDDLDEVSLIVAHALVKLPVDTIDKIISRGGSGITSGGKGTPRKKIYERNEASNRVEQRTKNSKSEPKSPLSKGDKIKNDANRIALARARQSQMLKDNTGFNISPNSWDKYPSIGRNGTFITDKQAINDAIGAIPAGQKQITISRAQATQIERDMGLENGSLANGFKIREIGDIGKMAPRSPVEGNAHFLGPGKHLPGGAPEMVINSISTKDSKEVKTILEVLIK